MHENKYNAIIGYSGHALVVLDAARLQGLDIEYYCEPSEISNNVFGLRYLGDERKPDFEWERVSSCVLGIGENLIRHNIAKGITSRGIEIKNVIHPSAILSKFSHFGPGNFFNAQCTVNAEVKIGAYCIFNTGCIVEHECILENAVHVAPGAILAGNVIVGENTFIGANAVIKQGVKIGKNVIIGAGSVVLNDVGDHQKVVGNPARKIKS